MTTKEHGLKKKKKEKLTKDEKLKLSQKMDSEETGRVSFFQQKTDSTKQLAIQNILFSLVFFSGSVLLKMEKCAANRRARINATNKMGVFCKFLSPPSPLKFGRNGKANTIKLTMHNLLFSTGGASLYETSATLQAESQPSL